jgi:hypothetical protein
MKGCIGLCKMRKYLGVYSIEVGLYKIVQSEDLALLSEQAYLRPVLVMETDEASANLFGKRIDITGCGAEIYYHLCTTEHDFKTQFSPDESIKLLVLPALAGLPVVHE